MSTIMQNFKLSRLTAIIALTLAMTLLTGSVTADDAGDVLAIVTNKSTPLDSVTMPELLKIFREEKNRAGDVRLVVAMREPGSPERAAALKYIYNLSDSEYSKYFLQATFTGAVQAAPKKVTGAAGMKAFVAGTPGAVGYIKASEVDDSVKVIKVDGKAPTDAGYPIKAN